VAPINTKIKFSLQFSLYTPNTQFHSNGHSVNCEVREKTNKMQQLDVYFQQFLNMFRASLCPSSGEQDVYYCTWCAALVLLDVVGSGCGALPCGVRSTPHAVTYVLFS